MEKIINLSDQHTILDFMDKKIIEDKIKGGPKRTRIIITDHDTGEVLQDVENKIVISGSMFSAENAFGVKPPIILPSYNDELQLDNTVAEDIEPKNRPIVCLFCIGDDGCGNKPTDVFTAKYTDRIAPEGVFPFRYVDIDNDINEDLRKYYFGRKVLRDEGKIAYYFKAFHTEPQMHLRYTDGTQINSEMYNISTNQAAECYIETRLRVTRTDFRDYFEQVLGWDKARISTLSLCYAWYDDTIDEYKWYQDIYPYSKLNFSVEHLVELTKAIDFRYMVYY